MCGIVGHVGPQSSTAVVLEGLKRLEYRGYDSAGVCYLNRNDEVVDYKKAGKIENLISLLKDIDTDSKICIGHTRWATHGKVNDQNSHPHRNGNLALVHNGIIENASELREVLKKEGYQFASETDSEVFLALLKMGQKHQKDLKALILECFQKVRGNSAFVIFDGEGHEIYAIKRGAPLVCGTKVSESQSLVSSDPYALVGMVDTLYFPEDNVLCHLSAKLDKFLNFYDLQGNPTGKVECKKQEMSLDATDKGEYEHFMLKEIYEQPGLIRQLSEYYLKGEGLKNLEGIKGLSPERIHISACGTAAYAGFLVRDYLERFNRIPTIIELASEFRYREPILSANDLGLFISQSGETADTLAAQSLCLDQKIKTLSLVNVEGSTLYRQSDYNFLIRAGVEIGVASTKAFTQMGLTGRLVSEAMIGLSSESINKLYDKLQLLASRIDGLLGRVDELKTIAESIYNYKGYFFTGRGIYYPVALEGALKLKEIAYVHAEGYASGELKHGPIALIDEEMVNIAIVGPELTEKTISNIQEIKARKGVVVTLGLEGISELNEISDYFFALDYQGLDELSPIYVNIANQLLAYYMAKFKGTDIDKPRNLAKSVTVE